jgi:hypothetical protein
MMSNKSKSRKRKHYRKLGKGILLAVSVMCEVINMMKKEREKKYPKFTSGGTNLHYKPYELQGGEIIVLKNKLNFINNRLSLFF